MLFLLVIYLSVNQSIYRRKQAQYQGQIVFIVQNFKIQNPIKLDVKFT